MTAQSREMTAEGRDITAPIVPIAEVVANYMTVARIVWFVVIALNFLTVLVLLVPLIVSVLVSFQPEEYVALPSPDEMSLRWYILFFAEWQWVDSLKSTLYIAALTIAISFPLGLFAAIALSRYDFKFKALVNLAIMVPLFVPPVILGLGSLTFHRSVGIWDSHLSVALVHTLWGMPLVFIVLKSTLAGVDPAIEEAAAGLGANPVRVFFEMTLPLVAAGAFVAILFAFIISVNEFIMTLFVSTADVKPLTVAIWPQIKYLLTPIVAAASSLIVMITVVLLVVAGWSINLRRLVEFR